MSMCFWDFLCVCEGSMFFSFHMTVENDNNTSNYIICCHFFFFIFVWHHTFDFPCSHVVKGAEILISPYMGNPLPSAPSYLKAKQSDACSLTKLALKRSTFYPVNFLINVEVQFLFGERLHKSDWASGQARVTTTPPPPSWVTNHPAN